MKFQLQLPIPGKEFMSKPAQDYFKENNIYFRAKTSDKKASVVEWSIYRIKKVLYAEMYSLETRNWPNLLTKVVDKINDTPSPSLNFLKPSDIKSPADDYKVDLKKTFKPTPWRSYTESSDKYKEDGDLSIGDTVIVDLKRKNFEKSYLRRVSAFFYCTIFSQNVPFFENAAFFGKIVQFVGLVSIFWEFCCLL